MHYKKIQVYVYLYITQVFEDNTKIFVNCYNLVLQVLS